MAEDAEDTMPEIEVSATATGTTARKKRSPWKAALMGLPGGPLVSLGFGLAQHFRNKSELEREAKMQVVDRNERESLKEMLNSEYAIADDDEKRMLKIAQERIGHGYELVAAGDKRGYDMIEKARAIMEGIVGGDIQARKQEQASQWSFQRQMVGDAAKGYQKEYQATVDNLNGIDHQSTKILDLVSRSDFDPNKPINKAHLAELLSMGGLMFKDTPDMMDGLTQGVSSLNGIAGGVLGGIATMMKSQDFKVTPADYNRLALNAQKYARLFADRKMTQLGDQGRSLDEWGKKIGVLPAEYSLSNYISGGEKEIRTMPNPYGKGYEPSPDQIRQENLLRETATEQLLRMNPNRNRGASGSWGPPRRPTN
jgi:hypothetical protein